MEKLFRFSKWFILFCALLVAARLAQQYVADRALEERAAVIGERIYGWQWQNISGDLQLNSQAKVLQSKVIKRGPNDGQVRIQGNQIVILPEKSVGTGDLPKGASNTKDKSKDNSMAVTSVDNKPLESKFTAVITLYKDKDKWLLGKVEAE